MTTKHVSASVDAPKLVRDLLPLARQGGATVNLPVELRRADRQGRARRPRWTSTSGQEDRILRRLQVASTSTSPWPEQPGGARAQSTSTCELSDVNKPQDITAPKKVAAAAPPTPRPAPSRAPMLGVGVLAIDPPPGLAAARKAGFRIGDVTSPAPITNNPRKVAAAVRKHQKVVILFRNPRGLDDQANTEVDARPARPDQAPRCSSTTSAAWTASGRSCRTWA